jgi:hypothetical protein
MPFADGHGQGRLGLVKVVSTASRRAILVFAVAILTCGIAAGDTLAITGLGLGDKNFYLDENGSTTPTEIGFAGILDINLTKTGSTTLYPRTTMCVQLFTDIGNNTYNTTVLLPSEVTTPPPTAFALEQAAWLLDNETPATADAAAGLQLAIWKITVDGYTAKLSSPFTVGNVQEVQSGTDKTPTAIVNNAITYLNASIGKSSNLAFVYENVAQTSPYAPAQMLEGLEYSGGPQPPPATPESSTFMLAGVALLALGHTARRKLGSR